jgi:type 1 fimbriae regulatory protein FimB/type 1 fimbriae regulatory protein FimE
VPRLRWDHVNFDEAEVQVNRLKGGKPGNQPLTGKELRALRQLRRDWPNGRHLFGNERGSPMTPAGFAKMLSRAAEEAGFEFTIHPHMLRHACGYKLANDRRDTRMIQGYLGHRNIQSTVRYTELASTRFIGLWRD